jgi:putative two-component system response regulator
VFDDTLAATAKILVVDDEDSNTLLLTRILQRGGYQHVLSTEDPREVPELFRSFGPDLVLTDLHMPHVDGLELIRRLNAEIPAGSFLPIAMITADLSPEAEQKALSLGAKDFLNKPFKSSQILLRIHNLLHTRFLHLELQRQNEVLEERVRERTKELDAARLDILSRLARAAEYRDHDTGRHTQRVGCLVERLARKLGVPRKKAELLGRAAPLHDVGKIGVPDDILLKPGKLTAQEFEVMKRHVKVGVKLLANGQSELIRLAELIALTHHERWNGSGYPRGLKGDSIPLEGQLVAVADVFDTLVHRRPYKEPWPLEQAVQEIRKQSGHWFNPAVVDAFLQVLEEEPQLLNDQDLPVRV